MRHARIAAALFLLATAGDGLLSQAGPPGPTSVAAIRQALDDGNYAEAERLAAHQVAARQAASDAAGAAQAADLLVEALTRNGSGIAPGTVALAERIVADKMALFGNNSRELAFSLRNLGALFSNRGEFAKAIPRHERAVAILRRTPSIDPELAASLEHLALPMIWLERFADAAVNLAEARRIRENTSEVDPLAFARTLYLEALLHRWDGHYDEATSGINQVLRTRLDLVPNHPDNIPALELSGDLLFLKGDVRQAERAWTEALTLAEGRLRVTHPMVPPLFHRLAMVAQVFGDLASKRELLERAIRAGPGALAPCYPALTAVLNDSGTLSTYFGDFQQARGFFVEALTKSRQCFGPTHSLTTTILHNQAVLAADMGDLVEAERLHRQAVRAWSQRLGPDHPYVATGLDALAGVATLRGRNFEASQLLERALRLRVRALGAESPDVASTLVSLARTTAAGGNAARAIQQVDRAIAIYEKGDRPQSPGALGIALSMRGTLLSKGGDYTLGGDAFARALAERERVFGAEHPLTAQARADVASTHFALGSLDLAVREALEAEQTGRDHLRFTIRYLPERQALAYADKRPRGLDLALSALAAGHASGADLVLDAVVRSRGVVLDELGARAQSAAHGADAVWTSVNADATAARERFANLMLRSLKGDDPVPRETLDDARGRKEEAERALAERSASARAELAQANIGLEEVRAMLPTNTALLAFVRYDRTTFTTSKTGSALRMTPSYMGFVIRSDTARVAAVSLGLASTIDSALAAWREQAGGQRIAAGTPALDAERAYRATGMQARRSIWDPFASLVRDVSQVLVVPDGAINLVSFAALPTGTNHYLVEDGPVIHYLSTERDSDLEAVAACRSWPARGWRTCLRSARPGRRAGKRPPGGLHNARRRPLRGPSRFAGRSSRDREHLVIDRRRAGRRERAER